MEHKVQRTAITARINIEARAKLNTMVAHLLPKAGNSVEASQGKVIELLLLREDALAYVEQQLFPK